MAFCVAASRSEAAWSRPRARRTSASERWRGQLGSSAVGGSSCVEEGIVGLHVVGLDDEVVGGGVAGDDGLGGLAQAAGEAGLVAEGADEASAEGALGEGPDDGRRRPRPRRSRSTRRIELAHLVREVDAAAGDLLEVDAGLGAEGGEAVLALGTAGGLAALEELLEVGRVLDVPAAVPAADVAGDLDAVGEDADGAVVGAERAPSCRRARAGRSRCWCRSGRGPPWRR